MIQWAALAIRELPELVLLYAIPNGARTSMSVARRLKAEGMKSGVPDLCLPVARGGWFGMFIEMKRRDGRTSTEQRGWHGRLTAQNYFVRICFSGEEAIQALRAYLKQEQTVVR